MSDIPDETSEHVDPPLSAVALAEAAVAVDQELAAHEAKVAAVAAAYMNRGSSISPLSSTPQRRWFWPVLVGVLALVVAAVVVPLLMVNGELQQSSGGVTSDLAQFARYEQGLSANVAAVARVERGAIRTSSGGAVVWAEKANGVCWGVVVSGGTSTNVEPQSMALCH